MTTISVVLLLVVRLPPGSPTWLPQPARATDAYIEFFTATIRNRNTRLAYARCYQFFHWCQENGLTLDSVRPFHVAAYIEQMPGSKPTIKQKLAAIRMLYDFLVIRQLVPVNPTASVRGPKYVVKRGKTPVWSREDTKKLLESIPRDDLAGLRDGDGVPTGGRPNSRVTSRHFAGLRRGLARQRLSYRQWHGHLRNGR
jgi:hypothetical protein